MLDLFIAFGVFGLLVFVVVPDWSGEARLVLAVLFGLAAIVLLKIPASVLAGWFNG